MILIEYFRTMYEKIQSNWNVEFALDFFGNGKTNEGTEESKAIKRYYIKPFDKRFQQIFLNFNSDRNVESIVWFFNENGSELLTLNELQHLFGAFKIQNIIYDETTELIFIPKNNEHIQSVSTSILEWVQTRKDGTLYFLKEKNEMNIDENYKISSLTFIMKKPF
jgi:hypothetical protein